MKPSFGSPSGDNVMKLQQSPRLIERVHYVCCSNSFPHLFLDLNINARPGVGSEWAAEITTARDGRGALDLK
jgi:hypothetical protein